MSDALNHYYCGEYTLNNLTNGVKDIINRNRKIFDLGTQGPDFFLYDGVLPWKKNKGLVKYGSFLHKNNTNKMFLNLFKCTQLIKKQKQQEKALSYIWGVICHLSLDSLTHPYINYSAGFYFEEKPETHKYKNCHKKMEIALDILFSHYLCRTPAVNFPIESIFNINNDDLTIVHKLYKYLLENQYKRAIDKKEIEYCLNEAKLTQKIIIDKTNIKTNIFSFIERFGKYPYSLTKALYVKDLKDNIDYLNLRKKLWYNPCDKTEKHNESYPELFNLAVEDATNKINQTFNILNANITLEKINHIIKNVSFETGRPVSEYDEIQFSNSILI